jgi:hypothetical protein
MTVKYLSLAARFIYSLYYFGVGIVGIITGDKAKDMVNAGTPFQRALSETGFMDPLLCVACITGGAALFIRRTAPLGIVVLAPVVIIIFFFHIVITRSWLWGTLNLVWLLVLAWQFRHGFDSLWNYPRLLAGDGKSDGAA